MKKSHKSAEEMQMGAFRKLSAQKKIRLTSEISMLCLKLNRLNADRYSGKIAR